MVMICIKFNQKTKHSLSESISQGMIFEIKADFLSDSFIFNRLSIRFKKVILTWLQIEIIFLKVKLISKVFLDCNESPDPVQVLFISDHTIMILVNYQVQFVEEWEFHSSQSQELVSVFEENIELVFGEDFLSDTVVSAVPA